MGKRGESLVGKRYKLNCGATAEIISDEINRDNLTIKILENGELIYNVEYGNLKKGGVKPKFLPNIFNVGYLGNTDTVIDESTGDKKMSYRVWNDMLRRCYSEKHQIKNPSYKQCSVCEEWLCYANFEKWYNDNYYEVPNQIMNLDKDILSKGNKIYCPDKCIFVPKEINSTFVNSRSIRGEYPVGVNYNIKNKKFISRCCIGKRHRIHLGSFNTPEEAFYAYKEFKEKYIKQIADEYKQYIPQKLYDAMYRYEVEITD